LERNERLEGTCVRSPGVALVICHVITPPQPPRLDPPQTPPLTVSDPNIPSNVARVIVSTVTSPRAIMEAWGLVGWLVGWLVVSQGELCSTSSIPPPNKIKHATMITVNQTTGRQRHAYRQQRPAPSPAARWPPAGAAPQSTAPAPSTAPRAPLRGWTPSCAAWWPRPCPGGGGWLVGWFGRLVWGWEACGGRAAVRWFVDLKMGTAPESRRGAVVLSTAFEHPNPPLPRCGRRPTSRPGGRCSRRRGGAPRGCVEGGG
jgi:hypothetical protein